MGVHLLGRLAGLEALGPLRRVSWPTRPRSEMPVTAKSASGDRASPKGGHGARANPTPRRYAPPAARAGPCGFGAVIFTSGFRPDYAHRVRLPLSTQWASRSPRTGRARWSQACLLRRPFHAQVQSSALFGVGEDAAVVAQSIARHRSHVVLRQTLTAKRGSSRRLNPTIDIEPFPLLSGVMNIDVGDVSIVHKRRRSQNKSTTPHHPPSSTTYLTPRSATTHPRLADQRP